MFVHSIHWHLIAVYFITEPPNEIELIEGETAKLKYKLSTHRFPVSFLKDFHRLTVAENITRKVSGRLKVLQITNVAPSHAGTYCMHVNGIESKRTNLIIHQIPEVIKQMSAIDRKEFIKAAKSGAAKRFYIRVMIIGEKSVGKTCLLRRLMEEPIENVISTDGIDIERRKCQVDVSTGDWHFSTCK
ncbi:RAB34 [Mytilus edulis]|uniref:RAB34 n=1 Tax=Mytilus edulis TaxID=6550 RepID=A0A8S3R3T9_MYTED|nr:RAB34 [Mytilus edulis]